MGQRATPPELEFGRLVQEVHTGLLALAEEALAPLDITAAQWKVLAVVARQGPCRPSVVVRMLGHDQAAVSRLIARLVAKKLLRRRRDPVDARAQLVVLTPAGEDASRACRRLLDEALARALIVLDAGEQRTLGHLLSRLAASLGG